MPKPQSFRPSIRQHPGREKVGLASWVGRIHEDLRIPEDKKNNFFRSEAEANQWADIIETRCRNRSRLDWKDKPQELEALAITSGLKPGENLWDLVNAGRELRLTQSKSITWRALCDIYIEAHKRKDPKYIEQLERLRDRYPQLHDTLVCDLRDTHFLPILDYLTSEENPHRGSRGGLSAEKNHLTMWHAILEYGLPPRPYLKENPIDLIERDPLPLGPVETFTNDAVKRILEYSLVDWLQFVPHLVFGFFCGIRNDGELAGLLWSDMRETGPTGMSIHIRAAIAKTRRQRMVQIPPNAQAWLKAYALRGGPMTDKVCPFTDDERNYRQRVCVDVVGMSEWIHSGMRHTFCSNWLPVNDNNLFKLIELTGHTSPRTLKHYVDWIPRDEAEEFWAIAPPPPDAPRIVPFCTHEERWVPVSGFEGYEVSDHGRVCLLEKVSGTVKLLDNQVGEIRAALADGANQYQLAKQYGVNQSQISFIGLGKRKERFNQYKDGRRILRSRKPSTRDDLIVMLIKGGKKMYRPVHVLVAEAFLSPPPANHLIHHKDLCHQNNRADNLEWIHMSKLISYAKRRKEGYGTQAALKRAQSVDSVPEIRYWTATETELHSAESVVDTPANISA